MTTAVETLDGRLTCGAAAALFAEHKLRRAPVTKNGKVIGMLTDRDLARISPDSITALDQDATHPAFSRHIETVIHHELFSVHPNDSVEQAAQLMLRCKVSALPVIEDGQAKGILTESDIFRLFVRRGMSQRGHRLVLRAPARAVSKLDPASIAVGMGAHIFDLAIYPLEKSRVAISLKVRAVSIDALIAAYLSHQYELVLVENS